MTEQEIKEKREAIREGIAVSHAEEMFRDDFYGAYVTDGDRERCRLWADRLIKELSSLGVVIADKDRHVVGAYLADEEKAEYYYACYPLEEK